MDRRIPTAWTRLKAVQGETEPGNDGSPASNPGLLASTSPEDLLRKCLFAWTEILLAKALLSSELFCSFLNPSTK